MYASSSPIDKSTEIQYLTCSIEYVATIPLRTTAEEDDPDVTRHT